MASGLMAPILDLTVRPEMVMRPSPALLELATLLPLSSDELEATVEDELAANPALERVEPAGCPACGDRFVSRCPLCGHWRGAPRHSDPPSSSMPDLPGRTTAADDLLADARLALAEADVPIAESIVWNLDPHGFLREGASDIAHRLGVDPTRVEGVLRVLRQIGPRAIAARDVREALLLQLDRLDVSRAEDEPLGAADRIHRTARTVVARHLEALARGSVATIARDLDIPVADVVAARRYIREHLWPYPTSGLPDAAPVPAIFPDIVVTRGPEGGSFYVEVVDEARFALRVDPNYRRLANPASPEARPSSSALDAVAARRIADGVKRADFFIRRLEERTSTIRRVAESIVAHQAAFVDDGPRGLLPLTRARVADELGVHESTVSRAVTGKHALLPSGRLVPLRDFFDASLRVHDALRQILGTEDRGLSDSELAEELRGRGYHVARRTVTKYRHRLGVPVAGARVRRADVVRV